MGYVDKFYSFHKSLTFDCVLIQPTPVSHVQSRLDANLTSKLTKNITLDLPIIGSPMDRVTNFTVAHEMNKFGAVACFHRFQSVDDQVSQVMLAHEAGHNVIVAAISAQIADVVEIERIKRLAPLVNAFVIDTAMGTNIKVLNSIEKIKKMAPGVDVIAGNVVNPEGCSQLIEAGADAIRTGIGNGSGCLTRLQTGVGRGQLSVIIECEDICKKHEVSLISDGGVYNPGHFAKAIAAGADIVMMGSPLAGHVESPGEVFYKYDGHFFKADDLIFRSSVGNMKASNIEGLPQYKQYRGMASKEAQTDWRGGLKAGTTFEGVQKYLAHKGELSETLINYRGGLRSAFTYCNARTIEEFQANVKFEKLSLGAMKESYER